MPSLLRARRKRPCLHLRMADVETLHPRRDEIPLQRLPQRFEQILLVAGRACRMRAPLALWTPLPPSVPSAAGGREHDLPALLWSASLTAMTSEVLFTRNSAVVSRE